MSGRRDPPACPPDSEEEELEQRRVPVLCCARCQQPLCFAGDLHVERYGTGDEDPAGWDIMRSACFSYDLDLLGVEDVQAYSATNPGAVRFDVVRIDANRRQPLTAEAADWDADESWASNVEVQTIGPANAAAVNRASIRTEAGSKRSSRTGEPLHAN